MSTNKRGTRYDEEFKRTLVNLYQNGNKSQAALCEEYGVSITALSRWIKQYSTVETDDGEVLTASLNFLSFTNFCVSSNTYVLYSSKHFPIKSCNLLSSEGKVKADLLS